MYQLDTGKTGFGCTLRDNGVLARCVARAGEASATLGATPAATL